MKETLPILLAFVAAFLTGCFEMEDTFTVNADGSGNWKFRMTLGPKMVAMKSSGDGFKMEGDIVSDEKKLRAAVAKAKGVRLVSFSETKHDGKITTKGEIEFESIVDLYRIKDFEGQLNWEFTKVGDRLVAQIRQGILGGSDKGKDPTEQMEWGSVKAMMMGLKVDRTLVLPNEITSANGKEKSGRSGRWVAGIASDTTKEQFKAMGDRRPAATCSANGIGFKLPLGPAGSEPMDLGDYAPKDASLKAKLAQVKIMPERAQLMRNVSYGKGKVFFSSAPLTVKAEITWPEKLEPSGWSRLTILEGSDNTGKKLKLNREPKEEKLHELNLKFNQEGVSEFDIGLSDPARLAETFSVKGAILLHVPSSLKKIRIPDIKKMRGKELKQPGLEEFGLKVQSVGSSNVQLVGSASSDAIVDIKMVSPDGTKEMKRFYMNRNKFRDEHRINVGFSVGRNRIDNPTLVIVVAGEIGKYAVPFEFKDLKMP